MMLSVRNTIINAGFKRSLYRESCTMNMVYFSNVTGRQIFDSQQLQGFLFIIKPVQDVTQALTEPSLRLIYV
jgi:hypothetical protein